MDNSQEKIFSITLIDVPDKDKISQVVKMLPLLHQAPTKKLLNYSSRTGRVMGFVYVARAFAFGNQPRLGAIKAKELYHYLLKHRENLDFDSSIKFSTLVVLTSEAAAHGSYMIGDYEEVIVMSDTAIAFLAQEGDEYRNDQRKLELIRFQALLRLYRLDEAIFLFTHSLSDFDVDNLIGADVAISAGRSFVTDLLKLPGKHGIAGTGSVTEKSKHLWTKDYSSQKIYLNSICESYEQANLAEEAVNKVGRDIEKLISLLDEMQMMALSDVVSDIKRERMAEFAYRFQKNLRWLLMGREEGESCDQNLVNEALSFSHMALSRITPDSKELLQAHKFVDVAEKWTVECHDAYGLNDLLWTKALLFEKQQAFEQCVEVLEVLVDFTIKHFEATHSTNIKAGLIQRYPGIAQKIAEYGSAASIFRACELRRGIALHEQRELLDESQFELPMVLPIVKTNFTTS